MSHRRLLAYGLVVLIVSDAILATADGLAAVAFGVAVWGLHMGMTQGLLATMVANAAPASLRGTAFGIYGLASGVAMPCASVLARLLIGQRVAEGMKLRAVGLPDPPAIRTHARRPHPA